MKTCVRRITALILTAAALLSCVLCARAQEQVATDVIVNAATEIIISNEGVYDTVVRDDNGALSIGILGWHATNALELLKKIVAADPSRALSILGASLYNEIIVSSYWETKIPTVTQASAISVLISTSYGRRIQDESAREYIAGYVEHGMSLGITEPRALVFFADFNNQNGYSGSASFYREVLARFGVVNLGTLYECSSKNSRRTRTYNFCAALNWNDYLGSDTPSGDSQPPTISNVAVSDVNLNGYTVSCNVNDDTLVTAVYYAVYYRADGVSGVKWYSQQPENGSARHIVDIAEFGSRSGEYCTVIYAFDGSGNYAFVELNPVTVPSEDDLKPEFTVTVALETSEGGLLRWSASASGGSGSYDYSYEIYRDGSLAASRGKSSYSDYELVADVNGVYLAYVSVTDRESGETISTQSAPVSVLEPIAVEELSCSLKSAKLGEALRWSAVCSGGEGALSFSYSVFCDGEVVFSTDYSSSGAVIYKPERIGEYYAVLSVKDERNQVVSATSGMIYVYKSLELDSVAFERDYAVSNMLVSVNASASGGESDLAYAFNIYVDGQLLYTGEKQTSGSYTFTAAREGEYTAVVTVYDSASTVSARTEKTLTVDAVAKRGDANCDGKVTAGDARFALRCSARLEQPIRGAEYACDLNSDGNITAGDARTILRISSRLEA